jgi:hypothetical protein
MAYQAQSEYNISHVGKNLSVGAMKGVNLEVERTGMATNVDHDRELFHAKIYDKQTFRNSSSLADRRLTWPYCG